MDDIVLTILDGCDARAVSPEYVSIPKPAYSKADTRLRPNDLATYMDSSAFC
jgi:hypothetical protein